MNQDRKGVRSFWLLEVLLQGAAVVAALSVVLVVVGPAGLDLYGSGFGPRLDTEFNSVVTGDVAAVLSDEAGVGPETVLGPYSGQVQLTSLPGGEHVAWLLWRCGPTILTVAGLLLLARIVKSARLGDPFVAANVRRLWALAFLVAGGGSAVSWMGAWARRVLLDNSPAAGIVVADWSISFVPLVAGSLLAALAHVWGRGVAMRQDLEGLV